MGMPELITICITTVLLASLICDMIIRKNRTNKVDEYLRREQELKAMEEKNEHRE